MHLYKIIFSPTGGTEKVANQLVQSFGGETDTIDLTDFAAGFHQISFSEEDLCIVAVPSFGGRVPGAAAARLGALKANGAKAILIAVYGNRAYEDTLLELKTILTDSGFRCIAAVAAVAEHSIMHQFAQGRPDKSDLEQLAQFGKEIRRRMEENLVTEDLVLPGNRPYREYNGVPIKPSAKKSCTNCGLCAKKCPVQAIPLDDPSKTDHGACISCMRCVSICPTHSREVSKILTTIAANKMKKICSERKENELFM